MSHLQYPSNAIPVMGGNAGKVLTTDGFRPIWGAGAVSVIASLEGSGGTTFSFTNIPQTFKHLKVYFRVTTEGSTTIQMGCNNYGLTFQGGMHYYSTTTAVAGQASSSTTQFNLLYISAGSWGSVSDINIFDYSSSSYRKGISAFSGGSQGYNSFGASTQSTTPINEIKFNTTASVVLTNYTATLYGWN